MQRLLLSLLAVGVVLGGWKLWAAPTDAVASPGEVKPVAVLALPSYDDVMADLKFVGELTNNPNLAAGVEGIITLMTHNQGLAGLDKTRPAGAVALTDGRKVFGYGFLPVSDLEKLLAAVKPLMARVEDQGEGVWLIKGKEKGKKDPEPLYVTRQGNWAFLAKKPGLLKGGLPDDPTALLKGLAEPYDMGVRFHVANMPQAWRDKFVAEMKKGAKRDAKQRPGESDQQYAARLKVSKAIVDGVAQVVDELDEVTFGGTLDEDAKTLFVEMTVVAQSGTPTAEAMGRLRATRSNFAGFLVPEAPLSGNWVGPIPPAKIAMLETILDAARQQAMRDIEREKKSDKEKEAAKRIVGQVIDQLMATVKAGRLDGGFTVVLKPDAATLVAGGVVADGGDVDAMLKDLYKAVEAENPLVSRWVEFDADRYEGVRLHTISLPIPEDAKNREKTVALIGETLEIVVGTGKNSLYVAAGRDPVTALKQAIASSVGEAARTTVPPVRMSLALEPLARFVAAMGEEKDRPKAAWVAEQLEDHLGKDHVRLVVMPVERGAKYRLIVEEGVLEVVGGLSTMPKDSPLSKGAGVE